MTRVRDIMTASPVTATPQTTVGEVVSMFYEYGIRHVPVIDEDGVVGVVSDRDLRDSIDLVDVQTHGIDELLERRRQAISDYMATNVVRVDPEDSVLKVIDLMIELKIGSVIVTDTVTGNLAGIVSYVDVLRKLGATLSETSD